ncbi:MAG: acetyl-CoA carboxylase biotin carboxyl carrier protein subunit [Draconibacterium sp.]|nr:MAG: acetyl-CoA carboxylase biotin carboxyl carrier protein subunit [Draconibacterium sp.]
MKKFFFKIKGRQYDVEIKQFEEGVAQVDVNGTVYDVEIEGPKKPTSKTPTLVRQRVDNKPSDAKIKTTGGVAGSIKAPLPGSIIKINVAVGDTVSAGDTVMVMEAMKMENNIQAETAGTVKALKVNVGDTVMQDDVLIELG